MINEKKYQKALQYRPETVKKLFPDSQALIVSGKVVHAAMLKMREKGHRACTIAANGRNYWVLEGALKAAARTNAAIIVEIAKSETSYCPVKFENIARTVAEICKKHNLKVVVAVHADHYAVKNEADYEKARKEIPAMIESGITSIAIDASHLPPDQNALYNIELGKLIPSWVSMETEVGEIKGDQGLSSVEDAVFHVKALNAHGVFPTWIALNNGSVHGIEATGGNIHVELTAEIHEAILKYGVYGAQHGTSGNNYTKLRDIVNRTNTTKANVATALQMICWGLKVNEFGNAEMKDGGFVKDPATGMRDEDWKHLVDIAQKKGWKAGDYKKLNSEVDEYLKKLPQDVQNRMSKGVEDFIANLLENVFYCKDSADLALDVILESESYQVKQTAAQIEDKKVWTEDYIRKEGKRIFEHQHEVEGNFDD